MIFLSRVITAMVVFSVSVTSVACSGGGAPLQADIAKPLAIQLSQSTIPSGVAVQLAATSTDANGHTVTVAPRWSIQTGTGSAIVTPAGLLTGERAGTATVIATLGTKSVAAPILVTPGSPTSIMLSPARTQLRKGGSQQFSLIARDAAGNDVAAGAVAWTLADGTLGTVSTGGLLEARAPGTTRLTAALGDRTAVADVSVIDEAQASLALFLGQPMPGRSVKRVTLKPETVTVLPRQGVDLVATALDQAGGPLADWFTWHVADANIGYMIYDALTNVATFRSYGPEGETTLTAIAGNGARATIPVVVRGR